MNIPFKKFIIFTAMITLAQQFSASIVQAFEDELDQETFTEERPDIKNNPFYPQLPIPKAPEPKVKIPETAKKTSGTNLQISPTSTNRLETIPPPVQPTSANLMITGLVWNTNRPQAIVNGQVVGVGDKIDEYQIVSIYKTGIDVETQGQTFTVTP